MFYLSVKWFVYVIFRLFFGLRISGLEHVPATGPVLVCSNHMSYLDPPVVGVALRHRRLWFMARDSLFTHFLFGRLIRALQALPVKRGRMDRSSWQVFEHLMETGKALLLFPEGTRSPDGNLQPGKPGVGLLIYRCSSATVIPVRVFNTHKALPKASWRFHLEKIHVVFGPPVDFSPEYRMPRKKSTYLKITEKLMQAIGALH